MNEYTYIIFDHNGRRLGKIDAILAAIQQEHPDAHWVENEKTHMIESTAQAKYNDVRRVERNYTKGVHKARKKAHNGNSNSTRHL